MRIVLTGGGMSQSAKYADSMRAKLAALQHAVYASDHGPHMRLSVCMIRTPGSPRCVVKPEVQMIPAFESFTEPLSTRLLWRCELVYP